MASGLSANGFRSVGRRSGRDGRFTPGWHEGAKNRHKWTIPKLQAANSTSCYTRSGGLDFFGKLPRGVPKALRGVTSAIGGHPTSLTA